MVIIQGIGAQNSEIQPQTLGIQPQTLEIQLKTLEIVTNFRGTAKDLRDTVTDKYTVTDYGDYSRVEGHSHSQAYSHKLWGLKQSKGIQPQASIQSQIMGIKAEQRVTVTCKHTVTDYGDLSRIEGYSHRQAQSHRLIIGIKAELRDTTTEFRITPEILGNRQRL